MDYGSPNGPSSADRNPEGVRVRWNEVLGRDFFLETKPLIGVVFRSR